MEQPVKSANDEREYRNVKLPNGIVALLCYDPEMAAAAADEEDGSDSDGSQGSEGSEGGDEDGEAGDEDGDKDGEDGDESDDEDGGEGEQRKAAVSMAVGIGSFADPAPGGLAHFCEHMLFMGTKVRTRGYRDRDGARLCLGVRGCEAAPAVRCLKARGIVAACAWW